MRLDYFRVVTLTSVLGVSTLCVVAIILTAGLWPFNPFEPIQVSWIASQQGLRFGDKGIVIASAPFTKISHEEDPSWSLEIWLQCISDNDVNTLLAFSTPENPTQFQLRQFKDGLLVQHRVSTSSGDRTAEVDIDHVLRQDRPTFITITSGEHGTKAYEDGHLLETHPFRLQDIDFSGQFSIGTSPLAYDTWTGDLRGLAIYNQELDATAVFRHYETWTSSGRPDVAEKENPVAIYRFSEGTGSIEHNDILSQPNLRIPKYFQILHKPFLEAPWKGFRPNLQYVLHTLLNIAGFVPLGFFLCGYLSYVRHSRRPIFATILLGGLLSLAIEVLQFYFPTRSSDMIDVITNTFGTALGAYVYGWSLSRVILTKVGMIGKDEPELCIDRDRQTLV